MKWKWHEMGMTWSEYEHDKHNEINWNENESDMKMDMAMKWQGNRMKMTWNENGDDMELIWNEHENEIKWKQALHICTQVFWWACVLLILVHWLKKHQTSKLQAHLGSLPPLRRITSSQRLRKPLANPSSPVPPSAANSAEFMCWATFACGYPLSHGQATTDFGVQGYVQTLHTYMHICIHL